MIPKQYRLELDRRSRFQGRARHGRWFTVVVKPAEASQWAVSAGKRFDKRAVVRNRYRRQIMNWLYQNRENLVKAQVLIILSRQPDNVEEMFVELLTILSTN